MAESSNPNNTKRDPNNKEDILRSKLNESEWGLFQLIQGSSFFTTAANRRRVELRILLVETSFYIRTETSVGDQCSNGGTWDILITANKLAPSLVPAPDTLTFQSTLQKAIDLDVTLEHTSHKMTESEWQRGLDTIRLLVRLLSARKVLGLCHRLERMAKNQHEPSGFLQELWLHCQHLEHVPAQRHTLVSLFVNIVGEEVRTQGAKCQIINRRDVNKYLCKGDKEALKAISRHKAIRTAFLNKKTYPCGNALLDMVELRGRIRHVSNTSFTLMEVKDELKILFNFATVIRNQKLITIFTSALDECKLEQ